MSNKTIDDFLAAAGDHPFVVSINKLGGLGFLYEKENEEDDDSKSERADDGELDPFDIVVPTPVGV